MANLESMVRMGTYKYAVWMLVVVPAVVFIALILAEPKLIVGNDGLGPSMILSLLGVVLSYYGLLFSLYAALGVKNISDAYFFKIRSPELLKKMKRISRAVSEFGSDPADDLYSQPFISEVAVALRAAKRINNKHVKKAASEAEFALGTLKGRLKGARTPGISAGEVLGYWEFYQKFAELTDEMSTQIEETRASA
jgi:hypothetical protein